MELAIVVAVVMVLWVYTRVEICQIMICAVYWI